MRKINDLSDSKFSLDYLDLGNEKYKYILKRLHNSLPIQVQEPWFTKMCNHNAKIILWSINDLSDSKFSLDYRFRERKVQIHLEMENELHRYSTINIIEISLSDSKIITMQIHIILSILIYSKMSWFHATVPNNAHLYNTFQIYILLLLPMS